MANTFKKSERLSSKKLIDTIFESGRSFTIQPFNVKWIECSLNTTFPAQIAFAVPKKIFRKAIERNKLKRRSREAYRKVKQNLYRFLKEQNKSVAIMLVYIAKEELSYAVIEDKINKIIDRLIKKIE